VAYPQITDLPGEFKTPDSQLTSLAAAWNERRKELEGRDELEELHKKMRRRWAIDTGMIEGLYSISRGTTELLIERGLHVDLIGHGESDIPANQLVGFLRDHAEVYDWLFEFVREGRPISTSWMKELHQLLTRHQETTEAMDGHGNMIEIPLEKGRWKTLPNNPRRPDGSIHEYCPPEQVASEMDNLVSWHLEHVEDGVGPEIEATWLHHRFTRIHPFQDGNGRVARAIASLVLLRAERFPFSVSPERRGDYIEALEAADAGDLASLIDLLVAQQRREFGQALGVAERITDEHQLFTAAFEKAAEAREDRIARYRDVFSLAELILSAAGDEFEARRARFHERLRSEGLAFEHAARVTRAADDKKHYYRVQIEKCAHELGYYANFQAYRDWIRLVISDEHQDRYHALIVALHGYGQSFGGVLAALGFIESVENSDEGRVRQEPTLATDEEFTFGYLDPEDHVLPRFRDWLDDCWLSLVRTWQAGL
jgi:Fic family protein